MRQARIRGEGLSYYHCLSRVVDRRFIFGDEEREFIVALMRMLEAFLGLRVVTYAVMSNHFHLLIEEPDRDQLPPLDRATLLRRLGFLYDSFTVESVRQELDRAVASGNSAWEAEILARYERRMGDVSIFMKELKQRFTQWYNRRMGRKGTLWEERFKSLLVEADEKALMTVAAYIDLNAVRAGMVDRVEDYRWCGYASAVAGNRWAREGLGRILRHSPRVSGEDWERDWEATAPVYRLWLYDQGRIHGDRSIFDKFPLGFGLGPGSHRNSRGPEFTGTGQFSINSRLPNTVHACINGRHHEKCTHPG
ncbi:MAG: transposase [Verrucomicrobiales bacterium]|nr:transposase [Verrucomicrobiales bacterium]